MNKSFKVIFMLLNIELNFLQNKVKIRSLFTEKKKVGQKTNIFGDFWRLFWS